MQIQAVRNTNTPTFGNRSTIASKLNTFVPEVYNYVMKADTITIGGLEKIVQNVSPTTSVKPFEAMSAGSNVLDNKLTGAYYHYKNLV